MKTGFSSKSAVPETVEVIGDRLHGARSATKRMELRSNSGINIERPHSNRYLRAVRPIAAE